MVLLCLSYSACLVETVDDEALLVLVRRGIGADEGQMQGLASNLADQLEAYRTLSEQIEKALVPLRSAPTPTVALAVTVTLTTPTPHHPHPSLLLLPSQAAYRKTTEGAGHVAQAQHLHTQGCSLHGLGLQPARPRVAARVHLCAARELAGGTQAGSQPDQE